jgi:hypothetical protein
MISVFRCLAVFAVALLRVVQVSASDDEKSDGVPEEAKPSTVWASKSVASSTTENSLFLTLNKPMKSGEVKGVRLANVVRKVYWLGYPDTQLQVHSEPATWMIKFDNAPENATTLVMELDEKPIVFDPKAVIKPNEDRSIFLPAKFAQTDGEKLRFEPQPHKNTVGYWTNFKDTATWTFCCDHPGAYEIDILQGCGKGQGGSEVEVRVARQALAFQVEETGHFQNFVWKTVGEIGLTKSDSHTLKLVPRIKSAAAVMDVRAVRLVPKGQERSRDSELADPGALPKLQ